MCIRDSINAEYGVGQPTMRVIGLRCLVFLACASIGAADGKLRGDPSSELSSNVVAMAQRNAAEHAEFRKRLEALESKLATGTAAEPRRAVGDNPAFVAPGAATADPAVAELEKIATPFQKGFMASFAMIILSELGDKTFFIAAILAMRHPRMVVFLGAIAALALMTVLSAAMGYAAPMLLPHAVTHYLGALLFLYFGVQLLREAKEAEGGVSDELAETEEELAQRDKDEEAPIDLDASDPDQKNRRNMLLGVFSPILVKTFTLTFVAEWGDRSQIATIALAAAKNVYGVTAGGVLGHALCTAIAVIGGKLLAERISEKTMLYLGGAVFLVFALVDLLFIDA
eukprot:TRINITY_DN38799_c0_g1_i1.p1 TRINITY_DN38799_c0_g1~~TRINITY_DN38799_c0_g1_i1.p1  ORF type:complete len:342 (+),score=90.18 TRINITY_DN38799_c0_g1_i1:141-1166(+)